MDRWIKVHWCDPSLNPNWVNWNESEWARIPHETLPRTLKQIWKQKILCLVLWHWIRIVLLASITHFRLHLYCGITQTKEMKRINPRHLVNQFKSLEIHRTIAEKQIWRWRWWWRRTTQNKQHQKTIKITKQIQNPLNNTTYTNYSIQVLIRSRVAPT